VTAFPHDTARGLAVGQVALDETLVEQLAEIEIGSIGQRERSASPLSRMARSPSPSRRPATHLWNMIEKRSALGTEIRGHLRLLVVGELDLERGATREMISSSRIFWISDWRGSSSSAS